MLTKKGELHGNRRWCGEHQFDGKIVGSPRRARAALFQRDLGVCCDCGNDCTSYEVLSWTSLRPYRVQINREKALEWCDKAMTLGNRVPIWPIDLGQWHVDHAMPLHLVDRTDPEAWQQWTLENLRTRCTDCHAKKTANEAKGRAKVRRIRGENKPKPKTNWPKREFPKGRGFGNAKRPMRGT